MAKAERPYSRVYWEAQDDPKFEHVWRDDAALATWLRLLVAADQTWPEPAYLPRKVNAKALGVLVTAKLIDLLGDGERYRIHGLDPEREKRSAAARAGGLASAAVRSGGGSVDPTPRTAVERYDNGGSTVGLTSAQPPVNKDETKDEDEDEDEKKDEDETKRARPLDLLLGEDDILDVWYRLTATPPTKPSLREWLERLAAEYGTEATAAALSVAWSADSDRSTVLTRTQGLLWERAHEGDKRKRREEADRSAAAATARREEERRREEAMTPEQRAANLARLRSMLQGSVLGDRES